VALIVGWLGISGTAYPAEQNPYIISGGLVGVFLLGLGAMLWLSADLRDEWRKLDAIDRHLVESGTLGSDDEQAHPNGHRSMPADAADLEVLDVAPNGPRRRGAARR
jgi:hypothetical protein